MRLPEETVAQLVDIAVTCCAATVEQERTLLVRTHEAIAGLPRELLEGLLPGLPSSDEFTGLIQANAYESAALRLLGSKLGYMVSRSPNGICLATVCAPGIEELVISAETLTLGLVAGLLTAVVVHNQGGCEVVNLGESVPMN